MQQQVEWHGGPQRVNPSDVAQLAESPVRWSRVTELFRGHRGRVVVVVLAVVAASVVGLAQPFLLRAIIDDALPHSLRGTVVTSDGEALAA